MSNLVKVILFVAFAIFAIGFIWAIVVAVKKPDQVADNGTKTEQSPAATPAPAPVPQPAPAIAPQPTPASTQPAKRTPTKRTTRQYTTTTWYETSVSSTSGTAWASAGVDQYGNAYAEAHAR